jgi:hypothetical protein
MVFGSRELRGTRDVGVWAPPGFEIVGRRTDGLLRPVGRAAGTWTATASATVVIGSPLTLPDDLETSRTRIVDAELLASLQRGRAYLVYGRRERTAADVTRAAPPRGSTPPARRRAGFATASVRDVNGDGLGDIAVSAPGVALVAALRPAAAGVHVRRVRGAGRGRPPSRSTGSATAASRSRGGAGRR